ncbi:MAG: hypothetical protein Q8N99_00480 [Nanoarchaeota archaeon]|nr:hypothetical protein [Nanoarchaeota archaeon]
MIDIHQLQILAQLVENMDQTLLKLEKSFNENDSKSYNLAKKELMDLQENISKLTK